MSGFLADIGIAANSPFDHRAALDSMAAHTIECRHRLDRDRASLTRWISVGGDAHPVRVRLDATRAIMRTSTRDTGATDEIAARVRRWFDLDLAPTNADLGADPIFTTQVARRTGRPVPRRVRSGRRPPPGVAAPCRPACAAPGRPA